MPCDNANTIGGCGSCHQSGPRHLRISVNAIGTLTEANSPEVVYNVLLSDTCSFAIMPTGSHNTLVCDDWNFFIDGNGTITSQSITAITVYIPTNGTSQYAFQSAGMLGQSSEIDSTHPYAISAWKTAFKAYGQNCHVGSELYGTYDCIGVVSLPVTTSVVLVPRALVDYPSTPLTINYNNHVLRLSGSNFLASPSDPCCNDIL